MLSVKRNLVGKLQRSLLSTAPAGEYEGIRICDFGSKADGFKGVIISSIDLIKTIDSRRFKTVRRHVEWLVNIDDPPKYGGNYQKSIRGCFIHFDNYSEDQCLVSAFYAGLIVHEATHGLLISKGFRYSKGQRLQIERICTAEQNRFYKKVENVFKQYAGVLIQEFDPINWNFVWNTPRWKLVYQDLINLWKVLRD